MQNMLARASRISKKKENLILRCFVSDMPAECVCYGQPKCASKVAKVHSNTVHLYYRHYREIILMATRRAPRLFGEIEMDQSEFGGRGRKRLQESLKRYAKLLPHEDYMRKAREIRREHKVLVFGILQRGGTVYAHVIENARKDTLQPIVRLVVEQGSTVLTDKWRGFSELGLDGYIHRSVNHSIEYVAKDGTHINGIERFWSFCKRRLTKFNGIARTTLPLHIKECEFRYNHGDKIESAMRALLTQHQNPFPRHHADKGTSDRPSRRPLQARPRIRRKLHTDSGPTSPRVRVRVRARARLKSR